MSDLPSKAARDAVHEVKHRDAPAKAGAEEAQRTAQLHAQRPGLATKAPFDAEAIEKAQSAQSSQMQAQDGREPPRTPDQLAQGHRPQPEGEQYLRLTVRVDDGHFSIVDSHLVAGPLGQTTTLHGGHAYEVTADGRVLHVGSLPDLGTFRSFANPQGTLEQHRHHSYQLATYEFDARVALSDLRGVDPSSVSIALYRVKQADLVGSSHAPLDVRSFSAKRDQQLREVGRVVGIPHAAFPAGFTTVAPTDGARRPNVRKVRDESTSPDDEAAD